jgi:hypothetical protein
MINDDIVSTPSLLATFISIVKMLNCVATNVVIVRFID